MRLSKVRRHVSFILLLLGIAVSPTGDQIRAESTRIQSIAGPEVAPSAATLTQTQFSPPLGFADGHAYGPHVERDLVGNLVEDTRYGVRNPDLLGDSCFGVGLQDLHHSGEDLYRADGASAAGAQVTAVADGTVVYADPNLDYPGLVVIVEHTLTGGRTIYSVYAHLKPGSLAVRQGQAVVRGQPLGTLMYQHYSGRFPERHPSGDDSHLHFEMRSFFNGQESYGPAYPACNGLIPGRGYTYPGPPDDFPSPSAGYVNPDRFIGGQ